MKSRFLDAVRQRVLLFDGAIDLGGPYVAYGVSSGVFPFGSAVPSPGPVAPGAHTLELQFAHPASPGQVDALTATLRAWTEFG